MSGMRVMEEELVLELCVHVTMFIKTFGKQYRYSVNEKLGTPRTDTPQQWKRQHSGQTSTEKNLTHLLDFLQRGNIACCVWGRRRHSADLPQGLEIPCVLRFTGQSTNVQKLKKFITPSKNWLSTYFCTYTVTYKLSSLDGHAYTGTYINFIQDK